MALRKITLRDRISYRIDNLMAWNPLAKVLALFTGTLALVLLSGVLLASLADEEATGLRGGVLKSWTFILDAAAHTEEGASPMFALGLLTSIGGMIVFALLIGLVSDGLSERMDELKKGRSRVIEKGHTLILGWNDKILPLIRQVTLANESASGGVIVILSEVEKEDMEAEIRESIRDLRGSSIVCRTGSPWIIGDLEKVAADTARAIVVLASDADPDESDAQAIRTVLALRRAISDVRGHAVVEVNDEENRALVAMIGGEKVEVVMTHDIVGRLMIQSARQPGLAHIYDSLLGFEADEFYLREWPELAGKTFGEAARRFPLAIPCGVRKAFTGELLLNPASDLVIGARDQILVIAEDDDSYSPDQEVQGGGEDLPVWTPPPRKAERVLFCGWRRDLAEMMFELDGYVGPGSELTVMAELPLEERTDLIGALGDRELENLTLAHQIGNPALRRDLSAVGIERFDSVLVLADENSDEEPSKADTRNLSCLLLIRDLQARKGKADAVLISEIRDPRTKQLVATARISDYVVSSEIMSKYLAQVAERKEIAQVWADLLDAEGNEIYLKDARIYAREGESLSFWELSARAQTRGEVALGYRPLGRNHIINPKDKRIPHKYVAGDLVIVISRNDQ